MYGISLFSGYGGIDIALSKYVRTILFCDIEKYAQGMLLSRMDDGALPFAPIWNDVTTLDGTKFRGLVGIIKAGFPCQGNSVAGKGLGLGDERTGLFFQVIRICKEASPTFIFLENVPGIRTRGSAQVQEALASIGYDTRWGLISASEVGANHRRDRWFCLAIKRDVANTCSERRQQITRGTSSNEGTNEGRTTQANYISECNGEGSGEGSVANSKSSNDRISLTREGKGQVQQSGECSEQNDLPNTNMQGQCRETNATTEENHEGIREDYWWTEASATNSDWWSVEPRVGRVANGVENRAHRIKALGNGVVPLQVKEAFEILMGVKHV